MLYIGGGSERDRDEIVAGERERVGPLCVRFKTQAPHGVARTYKPSVTRRR